MSTSRDLPPRSRLWLTLIFALGTAVAAVVPEIGHASSARQGFGRARPNAQSNTSAAFDPWALPPLPPGTLDGFPRYTITDLGIFPGGKGTRACRISDSGYVCGWAETAANETHAFLWKDGHIADLGVLKGHMSRAFGVSEYGDVVGMTNAPTQDAVNSVSMHPFLYHAGQMTDIMLPARDNNGSWIARDIDDRGQIAGEESSNTIGNFACIWQNGRFTNLGNFIGGGGTVRAMNSHGWVAGSDNIAHSGQPGASSWHACLWQFGTANDLGTLGGRRSEAVALNNFGDVVGWAECPPSGPGAPPNHAFYSHEGIMTDMGTFPGGRDSCATGINDAGEAVGYSERQNQSDAAPFLWRRHRMAPLIYLVDGIRGRDITQSDGGPYEFGMLSINNHGQIVGTGRHDGKQRAFLLTPIPAASGDPNTN